MTKKKGGGGGQYHLPKHLRSTGGGGGGGGKLSASSSNSTLVTTHGGDATSPLKNPTIEVLATFSSMELLEKVCKLFTNGSTTPQSLLSEGETVYLRYVYIEPEEGMKKKCTLLKTLYESLCELFQLESFTTNIPVDIELVQNNIQLFEDIRNLLSAISNQITHYEIKAMFYKLGGLTLVCDICCVLRYIVPFIVEKKLNSECSKSIETTLSALTFILFKIAEHSRGRDILKQSGMFGTLWDIAQFYSQEINKLTKGQNTEWHKLDSVVNDTVSSILYHTGEILNHLTEEFSLEDDLENLLVSANPKWFPTLGMIEKYGRITSDIHFAILDLPEFLDWSPDQLNIYLSESHLNLNVEDFDIHAHYPIIKARTGSKFLHNSNFVKWNPQTRLIETTDDHYGPGFYILRQDHHPNNALAFVKFIQFLYCGKIKKYQSDIDYCNTHVPSDLNLNDQRNELYKFESKTCDVLSSFIVFVINKESQKSLMACIPHYRASSHRSSAAQSYASIYDDTDKILFAIHTSAHKNGGKSYAVESYKKAYIKLISNNKSLSPVISDFKTYFSNVQQKDQHYDITLQTHGNDVDEAVKSKSNAHFSHVLSSINENDNGIPSHRFILACRSEYLRKVLEYEKLTHNSSTNMDEFFIQDISVMTLYIINNYMYCGVSIFEKNPIPTECLVECFVVSDLYMLFGLKKFAEERICKVLSQWKANFANVSVDIVSASPEMALIEELHEIATVHIAVNMKSDCYDLLKQYKPQKSN